MSCFVADKYVLVSISDRAKLDCPSISLSSRGLPPSTGASPSGSSYFKKTNDLSLCDSPDRCEANVNPHQIKSFCGACIVCGQFEKGWKGGLSCCFPCGCVCSRLWIVPPGWCAEWGRDGQREAFLSQRLPGAITHTYCLLAGEQCSLLPPQFSPQLTFWPINLPLTKSQRLTNHWKFQVYKGSDITRADKTHDSPSSYERLLWHRPWKSGRFYKMCNIVRKSFLHVSL